MSKADTAMNLLASSVRPLTTLMLVGGFIVGALAPILFGTDLEKATFATGTLGGPMGIMVAWWFKSREERKTSELAEALGTKVLVSPSVEPAARTG